MIRRPLVAALLACLPLVAASATDALAGRYLDDKLRHIRARRAYDRRAEAVAEAFERAGAAWPSRGIFLRAFKADDVLELWAAPDDPDGPWVKVRDFAICARSGVLGPKERLTDGQVPEGFYVVDRVNPWSHFHVSLGISYPNAFDRYHFRRSPAKADIFIHGDCVTIGCLPLEDGPMEDLFVAYLLARDHGQRRVRVHVFPCRLDTPGCQRRLAAPAAERPELGRFWRALEPGYQAFEKTRRPPRVLLGRDGGYRVAEPRR